MKPSVIYLLHFCGVKFVNYVCKVFIELSKDREFFIIGHLFNGTSNGQDRLSLIRSEDFDSLASNFKVNTGCLAVEQWPVL